MRDTGIGRRGLLAGVAALGAAPAAAQTGRGGIVTASLLGNLQNIHPWHVGNIETGAANLLAYSNLLRIAPDGSLLPDVAVDLPRVSDDGLTYSFTLRRDVRFHDGSRLTAEDVLYSYEQYLATARRRQNLGRFVRRVSRDGEDVFTVELNRPFAGWLRLMGYEAAIVRRGTDVTNEGSTGESLYRGSRSAGSGPFIPKAFQADVAAEFEANPEYFGDKPRVSGIRLLRIPDAATQLANLRAGTVDVVSNCPPKDFAPMSRTPGFGGGARFSAGIFYAPLNRSRPPFDNVHLRRAFSCAIDREFICNEVYSGLVTPTALPAAPDESWYDAELAKALDYDPDRAKYHLAQAGMPRGFAFEATIPVPSAYVEARDAAVVMQANLAELGIRMTIRQTDFVSMYRNAQNGDWTSFPHPSMQSSVEDYLIYNNYHRDGVQAQWMGGIGPAYDAAVEDSFRFIGGERKREALRKVVAILAEQAPAVWIGRLNAYHLWRDAITGVEPRYSYFMDLTQVGRRA